MYSECKLFCRKVDLIEKGLCFGMYIEIHIPDGKFVVEKKNEAELMRNTLT